MTQRTLLSIAAAVTAFVLVIVGGLATTLAQTPPSTDTAVDTAPAATDMPAAADYQQREAAYQAAIAEANRRLEAANRRIQQSEAAAAQPSQASQTITAEQAQAIALSVVPGAMLMRPPDLVSYQGTPAYEVLLDSGTLYVDAQRAAVLASSVPVLQPGVDQGAATFWGGREGGEHEGGEQGGWHDDD